MDQNKDTDRINNHLLGGVSMDIDNSAENKCRNWALRLEEVLNDFDALQLFQSWLGLDDDTSEHPLRLHFAIIAFREMSASGDARSFQLAKEIFNKFLRPRIGLCDFIGASIRERIWQRLKSQLVNEGLFDECLAPLETFLRRQHALFVQSQEFLDFFNEFCLQKQQQPSTSVDHPSICSASNWPQTPTRRSRRRDSSSGDIASKTPQPLLTADSLLRSQWEREAMIPAGGAELFKPVSKFPYMGQAHASKKDSAVSSSFSSEANRRGVAARGGTVAGGGSLSMRQLREGQRRVNQQQKTHFLNTFPKSDIPRENSSGMPPNCHETPQGRREFAEKLLQKLRHVQLQLQHEESVNRQIERINSARQQDTTTSTRELIIAGVAADPLMLDATAADDDADDDVENYFRRRMMDSSTTNSAQQSPPLILSARKTRRKSRGSCSPTAEDNRMMPSQQQRQAAQMGGMALSDQLAMSQSYHHPSLGRQFDLQVVPPQNMAEKTLLQPQSQLAQLHSPFAALLGVPSASSPHQSPSSLHHHQHSLSVLPPPPASALSQSVHLAGPSAIPAPALPKQTSPLNPMKQITSAYCDNDGDTSGIGSMTTTHSGNSARGGNDRQRAAMFRRARELSSGGRSERSSAHQPQGSLRGGGRREQQQTDESIGKPMGCQPSSANPSALSLARQQQQIASPTAKVSKMPICFRDTSGDGVWVVAHVPQRPLTFREFRHYLSISSKDRRQFFFKNTCEDGSAPYQLLLISDDAALLPIFDGKVSAECRAPLSDSD